ARRTTADRQGSVHGAAALADQRESADGRWVAEAGRVEWDADSRRAGSAVAARPAGRRNGAGARFRADQPERRRPDDAGAHSHAAEPAGRSTALLHRQTP